MVKATPKTSLLDEKFSLDYIPEVFNPNPLPKCLVDKGYTQAEIQDSMNMTTDSFGTSFYVNQDFFIDKFMERRNDKILQCGYMDSQINRKIVPSRDVYTAPTNDGKTYAIANGIIPKIFEQYATDGKQDATVIWTHPTTGTVSEAKKAMKKRVKKLRKGSKKLSISVVDHYDKIRGIGYEVLVCTNSLFLDYFTLCEKKGNKGPNVLIDYYCDSGKIRQMDIGTQVELLDEDGFPLENVDLITSEGHNGHGVPNSDLYPYSMGYNSPHYEGRWFCAACRTKSNYLATETATPTNYMKNNPQDKLIDISGINYHKNAFLGSHTLAPLNIREENYDTVTEYEKALQDAIKQKATSNVKISVEEFVRTRTIHEYEGWNEKTTAVYRAIQGNGGYGLTMYDTYHLICDILKGLENKTFKYKGQDIPYKKIPKPVNNATPNCASVQDLPVTKDAVEILNDNDADECIMIVMLKDTVGVNINNVIEWCWTGYPRRPKDDDNSVMLREMQELGRPKRIHNGVGDWNEYAKSQDVSDFEMAILANTVNIRGVENVYYQQAIDTLIDQLIPEKDAMSYLLWLQSLSTPESTTPVAVQPYCSAEFFEDGSYKIQRNKKTIEGKF